MEAGLEVLLQPFSCTRAKHLGHISMLLKGVGSSEIENLWLLCSSPRVGVGGDEICSCAICYLSKVRYLLMHGGRECAAASVTMPMDLSNNCKQNAKRLNPESCSGRNPLTEQPLLQSQDLSSPESHYSCKSWMSCYRSCTRTEETASNFTLNV